MTNGKHAKDKASARLIKQAEREVLKHLRLGRHHAEQALIALNDNSRDQAQRRKDAAKELASTGRSLARIDWRCGDERDLKLATHHQEQGVVEIEGGDEASAKSHVERCVKRLELCTATISDTVDENTQADSSGSGVLEREKKRKVEQRDGKAQARRPERELSLSAISQVREAHERLQNEFNTSSIDAQLRQLSSRELQNLFFVLKLRVRLDENPDLPSDPIVALACLNGLVLAVRRGACSAQKMEAKSFVSAAYHSVLKRLRGLHFDSLQSPEELGRRLGRVGTFASRVLLLNGVAIGLAVDRANRCFKTRPRKVLDRAKADTFKEFPPLSCQGKAT